MAEGVRDLSLPLGDPIDWSSDLHHLIRGLIEHIRGRQDLAFQIFGQAPADVRLGERDLPPDVRALLQRHHTIGSALLALTHRAQQQSPLFINRLRWLERSNPAMFRLLNTVGRSLVPSDLEPVHAHHAAEIGYHRALPETPAHALEQFRTTGRVTPHPPESPGPLESAESTEPADQRATATPGA